MESFRHCHGLHAEPPAVSGGPRKAEHSSLQGLLSTSTTRAVEPRPLDLPEGYLHDATAYGGSEGICTNLRNPGKRASPLASASPYSFGIALTSKDI